MADLAAAYADARRRFQQLIAELDDAALAIRAPACPAWTVRDVLAHVTGVAEDAVRGTYFPGAADAWSDARLAAARDEWTAGQVRSMQGLPVADLIAGWNRWAATLEPVLAGRAPLPPGSPTWLISAPVADLAAHLHDVRGALRRPADRDSLATAVGLRIYTAWLGERLRQCGRPALRLRTQSREWTIGTGKPGASLSAEAFELFRAVSGRRSIDQVLALSWDGSPNPYLDLLAPYAMPAAPLSE